MTSPVNSVVAAVSLDLVRFMRLLGLWGPAGISKYSGPDRWSGDAHRLSGVLFFSTAFFWNRQTSPLLCQTMSNPAGEFIRKDRY